MSNVPWHEEVVNFVQRFAVMLPNYEVACEHEHSNCVLIAHKKFKVDGRWHTWIDFDKFIELNNGFMNSGKTQKFSAVDYMALTPDWAVFGHTQQGFDPSETRWHRKKPKEDNGGC
ncbi:S-adenosyl-L-methionine-dependent tRNA 4-demethylwyosine synthase TYW1 [Geodia barretti]|uniref:S-adenosyl-L-methionine-dependent tRNA 4-demethylwyosine synthase TYW1 n=1 Tax=Geodia barretti TaxID=519541 RepID=A0AA35SGZ1_GEOBA|nr:S-adenosyl-L-methionine-dependent tRNA 4-demethylwyosine synthase TYW1 [Geodia barretti]